MFAPTFGWSIRWMWLFCALFLINSSCNKKDSTTAATSGAKLADVAQLEQDPDGKVIAIEIRSPAITSADLADLKDYPDTQRLVLQECPKLDDGCLAAIAQLKQLAHLEFIRVPITDAGLEQLSSLDHLKILELHYTEVKGHGLTTLAGLSLEEFEITGQATTREGLAAVPQLTSVRKLGLHATHLSSADLPPMASLNNLELLDLHGIVIRDEGLENLEGLNHVQFVDFNPEFISDDGVRALLKLPALEVVNLSDAPLTANVLPDMAAHPHLKMVILGNGINDDGLQGLADAQGLETIKLDGAVEVTGTGLVHLTGLKNLKRIELRRQHTTREGLQVIEEFKKALPNCEVVLRDG